MRLFLVDLDKFRVSDIKGDMPNPITDAMELHLKNFVEGCDQLIHCYDRDQEAAVHAALLSVDPPATSVTLDECIFTQHLQNQLNEFNQFKDALQEFRNELKINILGESITSSSSSTTLSDDI